MYQYKVLEGGYTSWKQEEIINELAKDGWELVCATNWEDNTTFYFKKEV